MSLKLKEFSSVQDILPLFTWRHFAIARADDLPSFVAGVARGAWGVWIEWPNTRSEVFKVTHLPTGLCMRSTGMLPLALNVASQLHEYDKDRNPFEPNEQLLLECATIARNGDAPGPIAQNFRDYWGLNTPTGAKIEGDV